MPITTPSLFALDLNVNDTSCQSLDPDGAGCDWPSHSLPVSSVITTTGVLALTNLLVRT